MGLMDDFKAEPSGPPVKCPVQKVVALMSKADAKDLQQAIKENLIPGTVISKVVARKGLELKTGAIGRHRRGECGCAK